MMTLLMKVSFAGYFYQYAFEQYQDSDTVKSYFPQSTFLVNNNVILTITLNFEIVPKLYFWSIFILIIQDLLRILAKVSRSYQLNYVVMALYTTYGVYLFAFVLNYAFSIKYNDTIIEDYSNGMENEERSHYARQYIQRVQFLMDCLRLNNIAITVGAIVLAVKLLQNQSALKEIWLKQKWN
ncbi:UNKNOWN [Stylonychia lemnae]|uniref:Uncharacterized protein n=1 Tax=Stylonychia lemnae TaxID=5949 RepID=A0A078B2T2_STYLE|nr:UNKNOWN [Stylonychia lemnae]|eukprot:CDW88546.1 UNKNOWN [Stylonychia lemnae]